MTRMMIAASNDESDVDVHDRAARRAVLVVDDDPSVRTSLRRLLVALGYDAAVAQSGADAMQIAAQIHPDLIIIDMHLGHESGMEVAHAIRSLTDFRRIPLIAMSSASLSIEELRPLFQRVLRKPFAASEMQAMLASVLGICEPRHAASCFVSRAT